MLRKARAMIQRCAAAIIAPLSLLLVAGCSDAPGGSRGDSPPPSPLLYEIASADGAVEGWMFGTIHALPDAAEWQTPAIGRVIDAADLLVVEVKIGDGAAGRAAFADLGTSPGLPPLSERLPPDLRPQLAALLERGGMAEADFATQESWVAAITLARIDASGNPAKGVDRALIEDFAGRPVREIEGLRGQLSIFDRLPETAQAAMLTAVVRESDAMRKDPARLQRAWLAGDAATIEASTREGILADPVLHEALLEGRNNRWAAAIGPMLEQAPRPLIAVGTAHLVGPEGLAALLAKQGYSIRRLQTAAATTP